MAPVLAAGMALELFSIDTKLKGLECEVSLLSMRVRKEQQNVYRFGFSFLGIALLLACVITPFGEIAASANNKTLKQAQEAVRQGEYELAERLFRERLSKNRHDLEARLGLSYTLIKLRQLRAAYESARQTLAEDPYSARAYALLGSALLAAGDFRASAVAFQTALRLKDDEPQATAGLAMIEFFENRLTASLKGLRRAVALDPKEPDFLFALAQAATRAERFAEAAEAYERFMAVAPVADKDRRARIRGLMEFLRYLGGRESLYALSGADRITVPFELVNGRVVVRVQVNDSAEPLRFVLDTGSGMSVISETCADRLQLKSAARGGTSRAVGGDGRFEIVYSFLSSLGIGDLKIENVPVYLRHFLENEKNIDGYIGVGAIDRHIVTLDYGARTLSLVRQPTNSSREKQPNGSETPIRRTSSGFISGEVLVEGVSGALNFIVDTGASVSVVSTELSSREQLDRFAFGPPVRIYGAAGVAEDVKALHLPSLTFGGRRLETLYTVALNLDAINETTGFSQSGILGGNFLRNFRVTFDLRKGSMLLEPVAPSP